MLGNGIIGILSESCDLWERRAPLNPSHCARLLHSKYSGVRRIIVHPCTKRIHYDSQYEDVGCEISSDLSDCGLIIGVKQPKMEMILPDRAYAFFSHTHKAQPENMPLLDKILAERASLFDYELIVGDNGKRLLAFGKYAGRAGMVDFLGGLGKRYLNLGYSTPFLSLGASYMYPTLSSAKAAVIAVGEEIASFGLPPGISPIIFVFTGTGNVSQGAQEIFKLLPHKFVDVSDLPRLSKMEGNAAHSSSKSKRSCLVYGCVVTAEDIVSNNDPSKSFNKADYYAHPDHYSPVFHEKIAPYASVIVNCMYWEKRFPRLLSIEQFQKVTQKESPLVGICDITCDIGGSIEIVNRSTSIEMPFFRYDPLSNSYHQDMKGSGVICLAIDILPTEFAREATQYFGDVLSEFIVSLASAKSVSELPPHLKRACICHGGVLTSLYEYIPRMRSHDVKNVQQNLQDNVSCRKEYSTLVSLSGHLFDKFLINEALDVIEAAGGSFQLVKCDVGQSVDAMSYSELEVAAADDETLNQIIDSLSAIANPSPELGDPKKRFVLKVGKVDDNIVAAAKAPFSHRILILGAGRVCEPAVSFLTSSKAYTSYPDICPENNVGPKDVQVIVASLYLSDAQKAVEGVPNALAVAIDVTDDQALRRLISEADVVISLVPPSFHVRIATLCIELQKHLVTASYVDSSMSNLNEQAKDAGITILCEMGLDPGIDHMMAMKMIDHAHAAGGKIKSFLSYCGGLPSPAAANNPLAYKLSWNPAGAIRSGLNPATFRKLGRKIHVDGAELYDSASYFRITDLPAFALECLPNRDSLKYGDSYGIESEASSIFRGTLRYEGFSAIMSCLSKLGFFKSEAHPLLSSSETRPTYNTLLHELLKGKNGNCSEVYAHPCAASLFKTQIAEKLLAISCTKENTVAEKAATTIKFLGLDEESEIPKTCKSPFDVICMRMEEKLKYGDSEQDMVLLHHELEVEYPGGRKQERHTGTLLEFGLIQNGRMSSAMARTVSIPAAIGAQLLLSGRIKSRGVIRPLDAEVYVPALGILEEYGFKIMEKVELI